MNSGSTEEDRIQAWETMGLHSGPMQWFRRLGGLHLRQRLHQQRHLRRLHRRLMPRHQYHPQGPEPHRFSPR